jgi:hypothetical protein
MNQVTHVRYVQLLFIVTHAKKRTKKTITSLQFFLFVQTTLVILLKHRFLTVVVNHTWQFFIYCIFFLLCSKTYEENEMKHE